MDLLLSAQSIGLAAFVTAGCLVAGGLAAQLRAKRRAAMWEAREAGSEGPGVRGVPAGAADALMPVAALVVGKRVLVAGVLHVEGSCCARLEDARPVAATTFEKPGTTLPRTRCWCDRARHLRVQVGAVSIKLVGPVRVLVGADELYPGCTPEKLRGRVTERLQASSMTEQLGFSPRHGVFRSIGHGDQVVVAGIVERVAGEDGPASYRRQGGGWQLRPDDTGMLRLWSRRRPRVRGAWGSVRAYAAALLF